jgi:hypothetical protein
LVPSKKGNEHVAEENCDNWIFMICTAGQKYFGCKIEEGEFAGHVGFMGEKRTACRILVGKPEGTITTWKTCE